MCVRYVWTNYYRCGHPQDVRYTDPHITHCDKANCNYRVHRTVVEQPVDSGVITYKSQDCPKCEKDKALKFNQQNMFGPNFDPDDMAGWTGSPNIM